MIRELVATYFERHLFVSFFLPFHFKWGQGEGHTERQRMNISIATNKMLNIIERIEHINRPYQVT